MRWSGFIPFEYKRGELAAYGFLRGGEMWDFHQGPSIVRYSDDRLFMHWWVYDVQECSNDGALLYSTSYDCGTTWDPPQVWMSAPNALTSHACLVQLHGSDDVFMAYREGHFRGAGEDKKRRAVTAWANYGQSEMHILTRLSHDRGFTWDPPLEMDPALVVGRSAPPFYGGPEQIMQLSDGSILLLVVYLDPDHRSPQHFNVAFLRSRNGAGSWTKVFDITVPVERGAMEPSLVELEHGRLYGVLRTKSGFLYELRGQDYGRTWDAPTKSTIPAVESMPRLLKLASGTILLVWNNQSSPTQHPRHPLAAAISADEGQSWSGAKVLADEVGRNQLSNFGLVQAADGRILVCTSHFRAQPPASSDLDLLVFDEEWLRR